MNILIMRRLQERARTEANFISNDIAAVEEELQRTVQREEELLRRLHVARYAESRAQAFKPRGAATYHCPCCAVYSALEVDLCEVDAKAGYRRFSCSYCGNDFEFETELTN